MANARRSGYGQNKKQAAKTKGTDELPPTTHSMKVIGDDGKTEYVGGTFLTAGENQFGAYLKLNVKEGIEPGTYFISAKKGYEGVLS